MNNNLLIFGIGCLGGLVPELLRFIKAKDEEMPPGYLKHWWFWVSVLSLILIGGVTAWLLGAKANLEAFAYGFSAPELLSRAGGAVLNRNQGQVERGPLELRDRTKETGFGIAKWWNV